MDRLQLQLRITQSKISAMNFIFPDYQKGEKNVSHPTVQHKVKTALKLHVGIIMVFSYLYLCAAIVPAGTKCDLVK